MSPSHFFFAPGMFAGPTVFEACAEVLQQRGCTAHVGVTVTTNTKSPGNPTIADNCNRYRKDITRFVEEAGEAEVIIIIHSAAGHFCSGALRGLGVQQRKAAGRPGGIAHIIFIAALIVEEGNAEDQVISTPERFSLAIDVALVLTLCARHPEESRLMVCNHLEWYWPMTRK
jgi:hypothetical protein